MNFQYLTEARFDTGKIVNKVSVRLPINGIKTLFIMAYDGKYDRKKEQECEDKIIADIKKARDGHIELIDCFYGGKKQDG